MLSSRAGVLNPIDLPTISDVNSLGQIARLNTAADALGKSVSFWNNLIIVFLALTALAAVGIFVAQRVAFRKADALATVQGQLAALKEQESEREILQLRTTAEQAREREKLVELNLQAQKEKTADAEARVLELEIRFQPRHLSTAQAKRFLTVLKAGTPGKVELDGVASDEESKGLARELEPLLREGGWQVAANDTVFMQGSPRGFEMIVPDKDNLSPQGTTLLRALREIGFTAKVLSFNGPVDPERVNLFVGIKP